MSKLTTQLADARDTLAIVTVVGFFLFIITMAYVVLVHARPEQRGEHLDKMFHYLMPVVTLVFGYYFGQKAGKPEKRSGISGPSGPVG